MAELQAAADRAAKGIRDPETMLKACERMDRLREAALRMNGILRDSMASAREVAHEAKAWRELELVETIGSERIREFALSWPNDTSVEVRRCTCGRVTARKSGSR